MSLCYVTKLRVCTALAGQTRFYFQLVCGFPPLSCRFSNPHTFLSIPIYRISRFFSSVVKRLSAKQASDLQKEPSLECVEHYIHAPYAHPWFGAYHGHTLILCSKLYLISPHECFSHKSILCHVSFTQNKRITLVLDGQNFHT